MPSLFDSPKFKQLLGSHLTDGSGQPSPIIDLYKNPTRKKEREHIEAIIRQLPKSSYMQEIESRLLSPEMDKFLGAWHELMVFDWLLGLGKQITLQPPIPGSKPEFRYESDGLPVFIEVAVVQESKKDKVAGRSYGTVRVWWPEATETFKTMMERLIDKMGQHRGINDAAYVICLCLESRLIDIGEVKTCFLGGESVDIVSEQLYQNFDGMIFENQDNLPLLVKYRNVSALLVAKHSGVSVDDGYKLTFGLIQNPYSNMPISPDEFGPLRSL